MNKAIRNIPDAVVGTLKQQASAKGLTLEAYIRLILIEKAQNSGKPEQSDELLSVERNGQVTTDGHVLIEFYTMLTTYTDELTPMRKKQEFLETYRSLLSRTRGKLDFLLWYDREVLT